MYCYDNAGNRTAYSTTAGATCGTASTTYTYNAANELTAVNGSSTGWSYDLNGNETAGNSAVPRSSETYTATDQLSSITTGGSATGSSYAGLSNGERTTAGATTYQTGEEGLANQTTAGTATRWVRDPASTLISERTTTTRYYYIFDGLGSVVALVDGSGNAVNTYSYDPYGATRASTGTAVNPFQYTGAYKDATGLYHLGARYYDPTIGRFTQQDPSGQEANAYTYVGNDPVNAVDPTGLFSWSGLWQGLKCAGAITLAIAGVAVPAFKLAKIIADLGGAVEAAKLIMAAASTTEKLQLLGGGVVAVASEVFGIQGIIDNC